MEFDKKVELPCRYRHLYRYSISVSIQMPISVRGTVIRLVYPILYPIRPQCYTYWKVTDFECLLKSRFLCQLCFKEAYVDKCSCQSHLPALTSVLLLGFDILTSTYWYSQNSFLIRLQLESSLLKIICRYCQKCVEIKNFSRERMQKMHLTLFRYLENIDIFFLLFDPKRYGGRGPSTREMLSSKYSVAFSSLPPSADKTFFIRELFS